MQNVLATSSFGKKSSVKAKIVGSTVAGVSEICIFHPIDTVAKRLMNNKVKITNTQMLKSVALNNSGLSKLYAGISAGFLYKVSQRTYKYGGQSYLNDSLQKNFNASKLVSQSLSGCMIGMGEVFLLPLDILKIRTQLFPEKYVTSRELIRKQTQHTHSTKQKTDTPDVPYYRLFVQRVLPCTTVRQSRCFVTVSEARRCSGQIS